MHAIGGLYVDIDVDCYTPTDRLLHGHQIVLQLETTEPKSLNNAAMASVPDHPFWVAVLELMLARGSQANTKFLGFKDLHTILSSTGGYCYDTCLPNMLRKS